MAFDPIPVPIRGSATFNADAEAFALGMSQFAQDYNALSSVIDASLTSTSTTSLTIGTGSKTLTVQTGLGYVIGYPLRISSTANPTNFMDGIVTAYNTGTGSLTVNVLSVGGSGTIAAWNTMILPGGGNFAGLSYNKFTERQVFANEVSIASASTIDFTSGNSNQFLITGTNSITSVTMEQGAVIKARFSSSCQLTHGTNLQIEGAENFTTAAGDIATFTSNGTVVRVEISRLSGQSVKETPVATQSESEDGTIDNKYISPLKLRNALNATGSAPVFAARAWVNFNGNGATGVKTPRGSANIATVTKNSTGNYTIVFAENMPSANYGFSISSLSSTGYLSSGRIPSAPTSSTFTYISTDGGGSPADAEYITMTFYDL